MRLILLLLLLGAFFGFSDAWKTTEDEDWIKDAHNLVDNLRSAITSRDYNGTLDLFHEEFYFKLCDRSKMDRYEFASSLLSFQDPPGFSLVLKNVQIVEGHPESRQFLTIVSSGFPNQSENDFLAKSGKFLLGEQFNC